MYIDGRWFKDAQGRTLLLRGVNLGGSSKLPMTPNGATHLKQGFYDHRDVSFVGRPFPLEEADEHFCRLKSWGLTFIRYLVVWEAIEHAGPGIYDEDYIDYTHAIIEKASEYGITVFIDPHQDAWSRWTGGDGAPGWTLEAVGMDLTKLCATGAAINHQETGDPFPRMIWPTNYYKLGAATMFTLFFAGDDLAPATTIDGINTREYLQSHFINAIQYLAKRLSDLPNIVGFDTMNEPITGYIGLSNLGRDEPHGLMSLGAVPTPLQTMALASGHSLRVWKYDLKAWGLQKTGWVTLNPEKENLWKQGYTCVWKQNEVWTDKGGKPRALKPYHFNRLNGRKINFIEDYFKRYVRRYIRAIREVKPKHLIFIEGVPNTDHPRWNTNDPGQVAYAGHWYDNTTLFTKSFRKHLNADVDNNRFQVVIGANNVQELYNRQLAERKDAALNDMNGIPTIIGEFGLPFDLDEGKYLQTSDFKPHITALNMYYKALEVNLLNSTIWNYTPDNNKQYGDLWNGEDLSIFSRDFQDNPDDINSGARALPAIVRPYPIATAGEPLRITFDLQTRKFLYKWRPDLTIDEPTLIFVPDLHYPKAYTVEGNHGLIIKPDVKNQCLAISPGVEFADSTATITITPD